MTGEPMIRPYREEDWPSIEEIVRRIWTIGLAYRREQRYGMLVGGKTWDTHKADEIHDALRASSGHWFVTELDGRVIGFCSFFADAATGIGQVGQNGVHPDFKGQGHGARQLRFVLDELRRRGMCWAEVHTGLNDEGHAAARKMYERAGFQPLLDSRVYCLDMEHAAGSEATR